MKKLILGAAIACSSLMSATATFATELTFWTWRQEDKAEYEKFFDDFTKANPDITIRFEAFEATSYNTVLSTALAGGKGPDLMMTRTYGGIESLAGAGYLMPLDDKKVPAIKGFSEPALASSTMRSDKTLYAVPAASQTMLVIYNTEIFQKNGISEPRSWDELIAACETLKAAGIMPFANGTATGWQNETIVSALTSSIMGKAFYADLMAGKTDFNDKRYIEALTKLKEISKYFPEGFVGLDYASAQQLFTSEMAGMFAGGSFELANFVKQNPALKMGVFAAPGLKAEDEKLVGLFFDSGFGANAKPKDEAAALKFVNYAASKEFAQPFANRLSNVSAVPGVTFDSELLAKVAELNTNSIAYMTLVNFRYGEPTGSTLIQAGVSKLLNGQATPADVGKSMTDGLAAWYAPFKK
ncbi:extracellular solute-binding protein (plasmid) [Rhizobium oryzihabitans]|uniref:Extracellular solute-binding protein n=3 Tax=Bacteria TaxID=2 RepID=A0A7L5BRR3_9HYPH|nr:MULTISPECIES: extracellular solute-binding protein [Rhizobium/Agrobacterium group]QIB41461.1 extracellular solute-binding protein [Rhizobium oryzihabitans]RSC24862.1 extracellular solute-binding protein [Agrobacterium sp. FDAARGOS_525]